MDWKSRPASEKRSLREQHAAAKTTMFSRWETAEGGILYRQRAKRAISWWVSGSVRVADIGCSQMYPERYLPPGSTYMPVDCVARDERTIIVDLNREPLPPLTVDLILALGLIEYLHDAPAALRQFAAHPRAIISYNPIELQKRDRAETGWFNAYSTGELEALFREAGFTIEDRRRFKRQQLWLLTSQSC